MRVGTVKRDPRSLIEPGTLAIVGCASPGWEGATVIYTVGLVDKYERRIDAGTAITSGPGIKRIATPALGEIGL